MERYKSVLLRFCECSVTIGSQCGHSDYVVHRMTITLCFLAASTDEQSLGSIFTEFLDAAI